MQLFLSPVFGARRDLSLLFAVAVGKKRRYMIFLYFLQMRGKKGGGGKEGRKNEGRKGGMGELKG